MCLLELPTQEKWLQHRHWYRSKLNAQACPSWIICHYIHVSSTEIFRTDRFLKKNTDWLTSQESALCTQDASDRTNSCFRLWASHVLHTVFPAGTRERSSRHFFDCILTCPCASTKKCTLWTAHLMVAIWPFWICIMTEAFKCCNPEPGSMRPIPSHTRSGASSSCGGSPSAARLCRESSCSCLSMYQGDPVLWALKVTPHSRQDTGTWPSNEWMMYCPGRFWEIHSVRFRRWSALEGLPARGRGAEDGKSCRGSNAMSWSSSMTRTISPSVITVGPAA